MGIAAIKVPREMLGEVLTALSAIGSLVSVDYPTASHEPYRVRMATDMVPDGEHEVRVELSISREGSTANLRITLRDY